MSSVFEGKLVRLRAEEPEEDVLFREWERSETDTERMLFEIPFPKPRLTPDVALDSIRSPLDGDNFPFTIETLSAEVAGAIHIHRCNMRSGTFMYGISILPSYRRKGYAAEAIRLALRYYFNERRYQKCTVEVYSYNPASMRLHESLGFTLEGRLRRMVFSGGEFHDALYYGITCEEFRANESSV